MRPEADATLPPPARNEAGAALLTVLILVAIMGALAAITFDRLRLATLLAGNAAAREASHGDAELAEQIALLRIGDLLAAGTPAPRWLDRAITLPLPGGPARVGVRDGSTCFNLNSLASGVAPDALVSRPLGIEQFATLLRSTGIGETEARRIAAATADWIDSDNVPAPGGTEDETYAQAATPYRTANTLFAETSEWRAVAGVTPDLYTRLRPLLCALPVAELSPINVNAIAPAQAPLLLTLLPAQAISLDQARRIIAERPAAGWRDLAAFWNTPTLRGIAPPGDARRQPVLVPNWLTLTIASGEDDVTTALIDARRPPLRLAARRWTEDE